MPATIVASPGRRLVPLLMILAATLAVFWRPLFAGETFVEGDLRNFFRPHQSVVVPLARQAGGLPLWNPFVNGGQPLAANPRYRLAHPATLLFLLMPFELAFRLQIIGAVVVSALSMLFLLRTLGRSPIASAFGAVTWAFSGYVLSGTWLFPLVLAAAPLPAALGFAWRLHSGHSALDLAGLALCVGLVGLTGEPFTLGVVVTLLLALAVRAGRLAAVGRVLAGLAIGGLLSAAALLPAAALARDTLRAAGLYEEWALKWSLPVLRVLELVFPHVAGHVHAEEGSYWGRLFYTGAVNNPYVLSLYPGLLAAALALATGVLRVRRQLFWALVGTLGLVLALGAHGFVWPLLRRLPLLRALRYPEKFLLLVSLAVAVVASHGFDLLRQRRFRRTAARVLLGIGALGLAGSGAARFLGAGVFSRIAADAALADEMRRTLSRDFLRAALLAALFALLVLALPRRGPAALLLAVCAATELVLAAPSLLRFESLESVSRPPAVLYPALSPKLSGYLFNLDAWQLSGGVSRWEAAFPPVPELFGISTTLDNDFDFTDLRWSSLAAGAVMSVYSKTPALLPPLLARRGVTGVIGRTQDAERRPILLRTADARPFAFLADSWVKTDGAEGWKRAVAALGPRAATSVSLEPDEAARAGVSAALSSGRVTSVSVSAQRLVFDVVVEGAGTGLLAVNQTWARGWRAEVDARAAPVLRADLSLQALAVPPGRHRVELRYADPFVTLGFWISGITAIGFAGWVIVSGRRGRRS